MFTRADHLSVGESAGLESPPGDSEQERCQHERDPYLGQHRAWNLVRAP